MKKLAIISAIAMSGLFYNAANAQLGLHIGIRLFPHRVFVPRPVVVVQPQEPVYQEPVVSDSDDCDFYYLPDVGAYYSVNEQCYYYLDGNNWISTAYLPGIYHDFDWRYARRFEINQPRPYLHNDFYRNRYNGFDRNIARYHDDFRVGFDYRHDNNYANNYVQRFNDAHRFDNRGGYGQHFDNNRDNNDHHFDNRGGYTQHFDGRGQDNAGQNRNNNQDGNRFGQQNDQNHDRGNNNNGRQNDQNQNRNKGDRDNQRVAQNNNGFGGNNHNKKDRF